LTQLVYQEQTSHTPLHLYLFVPEVRNTRKISTILHWLH